MSALRRDEFGITQFYLEIDGADTEPRRFLVEAWHDARAAIDQGARRVNLIKVRQLEDGPLLQPLYVITAPEEGS